METSTIIKYSIYVEGRKEADIYKWILSEQAGHDVGESALSRWVLEHWNGYLRARWLEHLEGKRFWLELDRGDYGLLLRHTELQEDPPMLECILDRLKSSQENLEIINWSIDFHLDTARIRRILEILDINSRRLAHRFDS